MDFRRIPFQFSSTDPAKRQAELQKRFGLPPKQDKMLIDLANPELMGARKESNSTSSSPRLQHRVPIFVEGMAEPDRSSADANPTNVDAGQKPRVRIVPIEIENANGSNKHTFSGLPSCINGSSYQGFGVSNGMKHQRSEIPGDTTPKVEPTTSKPLSGPKVCSIPVKMEGGGQAKKSKATSPCKKIPTAKVAPMHHPNSNATKSNTEGKITLSPTILTALKKIDTVLEKLKPFQLDVEKFSGTAKDKQYRYLDEMLTRLMLDLDNIETFGNEKVRLARKAAIKKVQHCIDLLDTRVNDTSLNQMECNPEAEKESDSAETAPVENGSNDEVCESPIKASEVEMKEISNSVQESGTVDFREVKSMDMDDSRTKLLQSNVVVSKTSENQISTLSNSDVSSENNLVPSGDGVTMSEVPEIDMEVPVASSLKFLSKADLLETKTKLCQDLSMKADAENITVVANETSATVLEDKSIEIEAGDYCKPSELLSDLVVQNESSVNEHQSLDVKLDSNLESRPHQYSHVAEVAEIKLNESKDSGKNRTVINDTVKLKQNVNSKSNI